MFRPVTQVIIRCVMVHGPHALCSAGLLSKEAYFKIYMALRLLHRYVGSRRYIS